MAKKVWCSVPPGRQFVVVTFIEPLCAIVKMRSQSLSLRSSLSSFSQEEQAFPDLGEDPSNSMLCAVEMMRCLCGVF